MKRLIIGLLLIFLFLAIIACAEPAAAPAMAPAPVPAPEESKGSVSWGGEVEVVVPEIAIPAPTAPTVQEPPMEIPESDQGQSWSGERMIVRTGDMSLVVTDVANTMEQIVQLAASYEGYVVSSNSWRDDDRLVGTISIRVPAGRFNDAIRALRIMAVEVTQESTTSTDVTEEYVDLSAKLHNLEASEAQLLELMKRAGTVEEILEVQRELTDTRSEIERTKGRMQYLEQTSSTSLLSVRLEQAELDVNFSANNRTVKEGQNVYFEPRIAGGISPFSYEWDFGDGNTSTDVAPTHAYQSEGNYNVVLRITDDRGQTASKERDNYIDVLPGWSAGNIAKGAWNGLVGFGRVLADIIIWLGIFSPVWIAIGIILYFAWWRRRKKKA